MFCFCLLLVQQFLCMLISIKKSILHEACLHLDYPQGSTKTVVTVLLCWYSRGKLFNNVASRTHVSNFKAQQSRDAIKLLSKHTHRHTNTQEQWQGVAEQFNLPFLMEAYQTHTRACDNDIIRQSRKLIIRHTHTHTHGLRWSLSLS